MKKNKVTTIWAASNGKFLMLGFSQKRKATGPEYWVDLDEKSVEELLIVAAAHLMDKDVKEVKNVAKQLSHAIKKELSVDESQPESN